MELNRKIRDLKPYDPITGTYAIRLDANESFVPLPMALQEEIQEKAASLAFNRYPDPTAAALCRSFAAYYDVPARLVTAGNGSDELISILCTAFLMRGETILTLEPDFSMYRFYGSLAEAACISLKKGESLKIDVDEVIHQAREHQAKLIIFSNPCNPTSLGLERDEVRRLIQSVSALVVLDEAYMDFWDQSLLGEVEEYDNLVILRTCSKAFGMAAIRLGFAVANPVLTNALRAVKSPYNVNALTQAIGEVVLREKDSVNKAISDILRSRDELYAQICQLEQEFPRAFHVYPTCTNFVLLKCARAKELYRVLLQRGIAVRFMEDYLRITAGSATENRTLLDNLREQVPALFPAV